MAAVARAALFQDIQSRMCFRLFARLRIRHSHALLERHSFMGTACASSKTRERTIRSGLRPYALPGSAFFLKATSFVRMKWGTNSLGFSRPRRGKALLSGCSMTGWGLAEERVEASGEIFRSLGWK